MLVYKNIPDYYMEGFRPVRSSLDNLENVLQVIEIINFCHEYKNDGKDFDDFDLLVFFGDFNRFVVRKKNGYFSMSIPFQVVIEGDYISFNFDMIKASVDAYFISIMRNAIKTAESSLHSHEDVIMSLVNDFDIDIKESLNYYDAFASLLSEDHGYFRFDDDMENENGDIHPRYHFDIFYKDSSSIKIGYDKMLEVPCLSFLMDKTHPKKYLVEK